MDGTPLADDMLRSGFRGGDSLIDDFARQSAGKANPKQMTSPDLQVPTSEFIGDSGFSNLLLDHPNKKGMPQIMVTEASPIIEESSMDSVHSFPATPQAAGLTPRDEAAVKPDNLNISKRQIVPRRQNSAASDQLNMFEKLASLEDLGASVAVSDNRISVRPRKIIISSKRRS